MRMKSNVLMDVSDFQFNRVGPAQLWHQQEPATNKGNDSWLILAPQMDTHQIPPADSQPTCNVTDCLNEIEDPRSNAVNSSLNLLDFAGESADNKGVPSRKKRNRVRGPKPRTMYDGNGPMQLWQFILSLLVSSSSERVVEWTRKRKYEFRILEPDKLAKLWGALKKKPAMTFKKLARGLRYYYGKSMLEKARGKQYTYEFVMDIAEILGYDPVGEIPESIKGSTKFSKFGVTTSTVFCEDKVDVAGSVGLMEELKVTTTACGSTWEECRDTGEGFLVAFDGIGEGFWGTEGEFGATEGGDGLGNTGEGFEGTEGGKTFLSNTEVFGGIKEGLNGIKDEFRHTRERIISTPQGFGNPGEGYLGIKLFDFSVLVESNETSSFYEAL